MTLSQRAYKYQSYALTLPSFTSQFQHLLSSISLSLINNVHTNSTNLRRHEETRDGEENIDLGNCLLLLSHPREIKPQKLLGPKEFECMTCNLKFSSFQALGGHRASHKKPKLYVKEQCKILMLRNKPKKHECSICGREFTLGQALGGHMKKHRIAVDQGLSSINKVVVKVPVLKRSNSKRVLCLDLNLTPLQNDLKLLFGDKAPKVDSFV